ncbi:MAG: SUMF1/EgtB/PvdO family nonheme iron enzyme [Microcystis aeruginosa F13-15]|jgi:formylglycine-generating enzyme required for sulfatase activity|nr:SUMF1/EgtB/PvdO family nonheme iron enzyme [Microcystis aeruginosa F13-15]
MSRDALVVGLNTYQNAGLRKLQAPAEDAEAIAQLLETYGEFKVTRLPEKVKQEDNSLYVGKSLPVILKQLKTALVQLFKPEGGNIPETALFYFSGHGLRDTVGISQGFLATHDSNPNDEKWGISLKWLRELLQESPIRQQIIWLDCCYSGELLNFNEANPGEQQGKSRCFIAASKEFEVAYEELGSPYSVLTQVLRKGLDPKRCPNRWVTNISLTDYLDQHLKGASQTPLFTNFGEPIRLTCFNPGKVSSQIIPISSSGICPYKGLLYFDCNEEDPKYFYGREELTDQLLDKIRQSDFLAIVGSSGSGKSSVLRAGLLHQLQQGRKLAGSSNWKIKILVPTEHPMQSLAEIFLDSNLSLIERALQLKQAKELLADGSEGLKLLIEASDTRRFVIVVDQFEEVFTLCQDGNERQQFLECLLGAVEKAQGKLCLILAMRADFWGKCLEQEYSGLGKKIQENLVSVTPMKPEQLREAIALPAQQVSLGVEEALIEQMLREIEGSPGSLPLLEYTLTRLWEETTDNQLKLATYVNLGGISGTLNRRATEVYQQFNDTERQIAKQVFLCLTQLGEGTEDTRRRVLKPDLMTEKHSQFQIEQVIQKLANEKLIVTDEQTGKGDVSQRVVVIDVAHEALIRGWDLLREWLDENRDALRKQRKIEEEAKYWLDKGNNKELLWFGFRLAEAEELLGEYEVSLSPLAKEFLEASSQQELYNYLRSPDIDNLEQETLQKEAVSKSFLTKKRLWQLLRNEQEKAQIRLSASWLLKQWGEEVPIWTAEVNKEGNIALSFIREDNLPATVIEELKDGINLEMVEIPGGEFWMGSPEREEGSYPDERPPHRVTISSFLMGKYPITQAQWRVVASLPKVEWDLNLDPSTYKGDSRRPVESISWYEAVEFCERLSRWSKEKGKPYQYRLPSEAEWEYACRAVISEELIQNTVYPPYHFGCNIDPALANYGQTARARTTAVGRFQIVNAFGLYDMHGNVWEWCLDDWHDNYQGAPTDGRAWDEGEEELCPDVLLKRKYVVRGGSWGDGPRSCRSAYRGDCDYLSDFDGFRVVALPRTIYSVNS